MHPGATTCSAPRTCRLLLLLNYVPRPIVSRRAPATSVFILVGSCASAMLGFRRLPICFMRVTDGALADRGRLL